MPPHRTLFTSQVRNGKYICKVAMKWNVKVSVTPANERLKLFELIVRERRSSEPHRIIRLWARTVER